jgi:hypothetical protein
MEIVIDRTNGGKGRVSNVRVYIDGKLMQHTLIHKNGEKQTFKTQ